MLLYQIGVLLLLLFAFGILEWNLRSFRRVPVREKWPETPDALGDSSGDAPMVSILVPARNEALRIAPCAVSLARQRYPHYEVIILDDHSTDGTGALVETLGYREEPDAPLRLVRGEPLPSGWTGKGWACHQLARVARGEYLLFVDADTEHRPEMLASAMALALETRADLLSAWPRVLAHTWSEKLVLPMIHLTLAFYPHALWQRLQAVPAMAARLPAPLRRAFGGANGQFLLFRKESYWRIGGHEAQKQHMVEDVALGRAVAMRAGEGMRLINCDGVPLSSVRMYTCLAEVWEGLTKNARAAFEGALPLFLLFGLGLTMVFLLPFVWVWCLSGTASWLAAAQIAVILGIRARLAARFRTSWLSVAFHPVAQLLTTAIALNSWRRSAGEGVTWKGRLYEVIHPDKDHPSF